MNENTYPIIITEDVKNQIEEKMKRELEAKSKEKFDKEYNELMRNIRRKHKTD